MHVSTSSFINFLYPFLFDASGLSGLINSVDTAVWQGKKAMKVWKSMSFPEDDLLRHVAAYLNPADSKTPTARLWTMEPDALMSQAGLGSSVEWGMVLAATEIPFKVEAVHLVLFRTGVGFLSFRVFPLTSKGDNWVDFLHYFRFINRPGKVTLKLQSRSGKDQFEPFFPQSAGGLQRHSDGRGVFRDIIDALLSSVTESKAPWWREVFVQGQMLPFASLFVSEVSDEEIPLLGYRIRNFHHHKQELSPHANDLAPDHPSLLGYAHNQWFTFSLEGGAFLAWNPPAHPFFMETMPAHLRDQYFLLFLLTLHQRFALMKLSEDVSEHWLAGDEARRADVFTHLRDSLMEFTARGYFAQVMQREHHHRCYKKWQEIFEIERLYAEVSDEIREMHADLLMKRTQRLQQLGEAAEKRSQALGEKLNKIAFLLGGPALVLAYLDAVGGVSFLDAALWAAGGFLGGLILFLFVRPGR